MTSAVSTHDAVTNPHSATALATASRIVLRDAAGRAQVADPSAAADIATKGYVDGRTGIAMLSADKATNAGAITDLDVAVVANGIYEIEMQLAYYNMGDTLPLTFSGPAAPTRVVIVGRASSANSAQVLEGPRTGFGLLNIQPFNGTSVLSILVHLENGANAGTVSMSLGNGGPSPIIYKGSTVKWRKLN